MKITEQIEPLVPLEAIFTNEEISIANLISKLKTIHINDANS